MADRSIDAIRRTYEDVIVWPVGIAWNQFDADGRPFGENNARAEARAGVTFESRVCPYSGTRRGKEMNVSALRQLTDNWSAVLADVAWARQTFLRRAGTSEMTGIDLWRFAKLLTSIPAFLMRRGFQAPQIPGSIGGMFKASQGLYMTMESLAVRGMLDPGRSMTAKEFVEHTESLGVFVANDKACSGPPHMIAEFVEVAVEGTEPKQPTASWLATAVGNDKDLVDYADETARAFLLHMFFAGVVRGAIDAVLPSVDARAETSETWKTRGEELRKIWLHGLGVNGGLKGEAIGNLRFMLRTLLASLEVYLPRLDPASDASIERAKSFLGTDDDALTRPLVEMCRQLQPILVELTARQEAIDRTLGRAPATVPIDGRVVSGFEVGGMLASWLDAEVYVGGTEIVLRHAGRELRIDASE